MSAAVLEGIVKAVLGGNTIKICHPQFYDREKTLILADVKSPRFGTKDGEDEKWAFESREFLRKKLIGKTVRFRVDYTVKETGMNYATIFLDDENINESVVESGWGKVKEIKNPSDDFKRLIELQKVAQEQHLGMWSNSEKYAKPAKTDDVQALLKSFKGKTVDVIVEYVISGTALKVRLPTNEVVVMNLTGVYCPSVTKDKETQQKVAQPFSKEAKTHTEVRLLNRDVTVLFEGIDNAGSAKKDAKSKDGKEIKEKPSNMHGSIIISVDENSDKPFTYQEELLMIGYVSVDERSAPKSKYATRFRSAEQKAKNERKNLWVTYEPPKVSLHQTDNDFTARVLEVLSGDTLKVVKNDGKEENISLSNIRTKKFVSYTRKPEKKEKETTESEKKAESEPWAWEARELLRSKVAGKEIQVEVDYRREFGATDKKEQRRFCTVFVNKKSVACELVREGYAEVLKLKADDERSSAFDQLILAENEAIKRQKGVHGKKRGPQHPYTVVTGAGAAQLNKLLAGKSGNTKGVVEKILSASKFVLSLPNDSSVVTFSLTGIATPSSDKPLGKELAEEAKQLTLISTSCRDVELVLEPNVDKAGSLIGQMLLNGKNYANTLLEAGLAIVQPYAKRLKIFEELNEAEAKAKKAKKGVWKLEDHSVAFPERKKREQTTEQQPKPVAQSFTVSHSRKTQTIRVTDFEDPITFYYQGSDVVEKLKTVEKLIGELNVAQLETLASATVGSVCIAQFSEDNCWYRAKVISVNGANAVVLYSDFGNSEEVAVSSLKTIPADNQLVTIPECAQKARLAFVKDHDNLRFELETFLRETLLEGEWQLTVEYSNEGVNYVTLVQNGAKQEDNLNKQMIRSGLVFADKKVLLSDFKSVAKSYLEEQDFAISRRLNLWELGEIYASDDDEY